MVDNVQEMPAAQITVAEGYVGNLTEDQHTALVRMWESYFDICDRARGNAKRGAGFTEEKTGSDLKKSGIPDDDAAKDEAKRMQEQQGMNELMEQYGPEALRDSWWNFVRGDSPDGNMLRFVRARKGDVARGLAMMATCLKWRLDTDVETFVQRGDLGNGADIPKFIEQQKSGKVFSLGCTAKEQPICYVIMKYHSMFAQPAASMQKFIVTQMETFRLLMHPPNDKATIFFDLKGFGLKQMDVVNLLYLVKVLESYYPESLGTMYISNAPLIFWGFWRAVKNLLDPVVRNKIKFIASPADTEGDVPEDQMIEYCGGKVKSEFTFVDAREGENSPQEDTETKERLLRRHRSLTDKFEEVTRAWCAAGGKDEALQKAREVLGKKLRLSQFELEPYTRGLTVYHRNGVLPPENYGISVFDYELPNEPLRRQVLGRRTCRKSVEQDLYDIAKNRTSAKEAEEKTDKAIRDGSWGEWRVNDNSDEIKKVALASLEDLDNTGDLKLDNVDPKGTAAIAAQQAPPEIVERYRKAAAANAPKKTQQEGSATATTENAAAATAGAAAAGGGAAAATTAPTSSSDPNTSADAVAADNAGSPLGRKPVPKENGDMASDTNVGPASDTPRPRGTSASNGPEDNGPTNYAKQEKPAETRKGGLFGSLRSKLPKVAA